jgi:hypothetical protein
MPKFTMKRWLSMAKFNLFQPGLSKEPSLWLLPGMRSWILPPWFRDQNNPLKPSYTAGQTGFYNYSNRRWISLAAKVGDELIQVDGFGIIYWVKYKVSLEIWVYHETQVYSPGIYVSSPVDFLANPGEINLELGFGEWSLPVKIGLVTVCGAAKMGIEIGRPRIGQSLPEAGNGLAMQSFEPVMAMLVVRPFGPDGFTPIFHLEYKNGVILANHAKILQFMDEPQHCFFTDATRGDVSQYFRLWEGNLKAEAMEGSCTGMVGFAANPAQWRTIRAIIHPGKVQFQMQHFWPVPWMNRIFPPKKEILESQVKNRPSLRTGTRLDELYPACIRHLNTFFGNHSVNVYQILAYNRLGFHSQSLALLKKVFSKVRWDGRLTEPYLGSECLIFATADYYQMTGDQATIEKYWPVLKRVGNWLCYQSGLIGTRSKTKPVQSGHPTRSDIHPQSGVSSWSDGWFHRDGAEKLERMLWMCASLQAITGLGTALVKNREVQLFKNYFLMLWAKLLDGLAEIGHRGIWSEPDYGMEPDGERLLAGLLASCPLQLSENGTHWIHDILRRISARYLWRGGFFSPQDFQGVDLGLTARLVQVLIREGLEYKAGLDFLLEAAGPAFNWPDRINPLTREGVGKEGHDPKVLYQMLLPVRDMFLMEDQENLFLLPGLFISGFWKAPNLELNDWPTYFGTISVKVRTIGGITQIQFNPVFRRQPQKILLTFSEKYRLLYTDTNIRWNGKILNLNPDFRVLRVLNNACLDNTFGHTL